MNHLKVNIKSASGLITLPTTVEELQKVQTCSETLTHRCFCADKNCYLMCFNDFVCVFFSRQSVATIGSTLTSVQHDVKMIEIFIEDQKKGENKQKSETVPKIFGVSPTALMKS